MDVHTDAARANSGKLALVRCERACTFLYVFNSSLTWGGKVRSSRRNETQLESQSPYHLLICLQVCRQRRKNWSSQGWKESYWRVHYVKFDHFFRLK